MRNTIIKITLGLIVSISLCASEVQYGSGTFKIKGGFVGLTQTISTDIQTYTLVEQHASLFGSKTWFYKYNLNWYDSKQIIQKQNTINSYTEDYFKHQYQL